MTPISNQDKNSSPKHAVCPLCATFAGCGRQLELIVGERSSRISVAAMILANEWPMGNCGPNDRVRPCDYENSMDIPPAHQPL